MVHKSLTRESILQAIAVTGRFQAITRLSGIRFATQIFIDISTRSREKCQKKTT